MGLFARLGYNFPDASNTKIINLSEGAVNHLNSLPTLLNTWQMSDLEANTANGYFKNPVSNTINVIISNCKTINTAAAGVVSLATIIEKANNIASNTGNVFIAHTNRISGVVKIGSEGENANLPHYQTAIATGRSLMYLVYQSEKMTNTAPAMGSFTSILIKDDLQSNANTLNVYTANIVNSIISGIPPTTNLSAGEISTIQTFLTNLNDIFTIRREHDVNFYNNSRQVMGDFETLRIFSNLGETQTELVENYIGSDKLLTRLNSANT